MTGGEQYAWSRFVELVPGASGEQLGWALQVLLAELAARGRDHLVLVCVVHGVAVGQEAFCAECLVGRCTARAEESSR